MSDSEKPFACTTEGCNMSFVNEDHLTVHKKKHDMMLNLGINNKTNFFIADQTPTPTRFIRNCEEVGLFQDLQNDNPFEETFRRAVESGKSDVLTTSEVHNDDTLHTPNIFPHVEECRATVTVLPHSENETVKTQIRSNESSTIEPVLSETVILNKDEIINEEIIETSLDTIPSIDTVVQSNPDSSSNDNYALTPAALPLNGTEMQLLLKTQDGKVLKFIAAPLVEVQGIPIKTETLEQSANVSKIAVNNVSLAVNESKVVEDKKLSIAKVKLKQALIKNGSTSEAKNIPNTKNIKQEERTKDRRYNVDYSKKQALLERNRASSMRARAKRKVWIEQLQKSLKSANETNANLQSQVKSLHSQVAKLKTLLLAHKDCPVTKAMEQGNKVVMSSKVLTIKPNDVEKSIPIVTESVKPVKRSSTEKLIIPKKKPIILSNVKNPVILPNSGPTANTITLHGVNGIKTIPTISIVTPIVTQLQNDKTILGLLHTNSPKVSLVQNNIAITDGLNENAASKTNGT